MSDKPILFSAPMVRALLDGTKTQTRLVLAGKSGITPAHRVERAGQSWLACEYDRRWPLRLPYAPGDRLWVKEAWRTNAMWDHLSPIGLLNESLGYGRVSVLYEAGGALPGSCVASDAGRLRSPIHMPRWASRITLIVTDVRVERLRDISEADAIAEGIDDLATRHFGSPVKAFSGLWNSLARTEETAWEANPWVTALTFTVHRCNIDLKSGELM